ncbi:hypothetical protein PR048_000729 [Dryococelus australis]|uniref:Uncharacterized protein n=1 Tax=Dryococelus australis TaxID=614101 RepID=A0ABQ9IFF4_9NEOP|nr:hypothetical protein PR048_000729 [Dryococelus australis]
MSSRYTIDMVTGENPSNCTMLEMDCPPASGPDNLVTIKCTETLFLLHSVLDCYSDASPSRIRVMAPRFLRLGGKKRDAKKKFAGGRSSSPSLFFRRRGDAVMMVRWAGNFRPAIDSGGLALWRREQQLAMSLQSAGTDLTQRRSRNACVGKREIREKTRPPVASPGTIPTCKNSGSDPRRYARLHSSPRGRGGVVVRLLAGGVAPGFLLGRIVPGDATGGRFSRGSPVFLALVFRRCSILTSTSHLILRLGLELQEMIFAEFRGDGDVRGPESCQRSAAMMFVVSCDDVVVSCNECGKGGTCGGGIWMSLVVCGAGRSIHFIVVAN